MKSKGFTIIEILVVIVVIVILAGVTAFAYGNWRKNVDNTSRINNAAQAQAALKTAVNFNQAQSIPGAGNCMGSINDYPAITNMASGACVQKTSSAPSYSATNPAVAASFLPSIQTVRPVYMSDADIYWRGIMMLKSSNVFELYYVLDGDQAKGSCSDKDARSNTNSVVYPTYVCVRTVNAG